MQPRQAQSCSLRGAPVTLTPRADAKLVTPAALHSHCVGQGPHCADTTLLMPGVVLLPAAPATTACCLLRSHCVCQGRQRRRPVGCQALGLLVLGVCWGAGAELHNNLLVHHLLPFWDSRLSVRRHPVDRRLRLQGGRGLGGRVQPGSVCIPRWEEHLLGHCGGAA